MDIQKIVNANVYLGGTNSLLGKASECVLPKVAATTEEHKALGMIGALEMVTGLALMTMTIKFNAFYADALAKGANPFTALQLQVRASVETWGPGGRTAETPLVVLVTARPKGIDLGTFAVQANSERTMDLTVSYIKVVLGGADVVEIDVNANLWKVNGQDLLATYRANIGA